jgi:hypothetical protein
VSLQRTTQIVNKRIAAKLETDSASSFSGSHQETTCVLIGAAAMAALVELGAIDESVVAATAALDIAI